MTRKPSLALAFVVVWPVVVAAQQQFVRLLRNGQQATLSVFDGRPADLAARKLVDEFGVAVNVEDPVYIFHEDVQDVTPPRVASAGRRVLAPKASLLEMSVDLRAEGSLLDVGQAVRDLADTANTLLPFRYRVDQDGDAFTLIATRTRDAQGRSIALTPILDPHVTIPLGTRRIFEHINLLTASLRQQTGVRVDCCQPGVAGVPWGSTVLSFEAHDEPARSALLRLLRNQPRFDPVVPKSDPQRDQWRWSLKCQPGVASCAINVAAVPEKL